MTSLQAILYFLFYFTRTYILCNIFSLQGFNIEIFLPTYSQKQQQKKSKKKKKKIPQASNFWQILKSLWHENIWPSRTFEISFLWKKSFFHFLLFFEMIGTFRIFLRYHVFSNFYLYEEVKRNQRFDSVTLSNPWKHKQTFLTP